MFASGLVVSALQCLFQSLVYFWGWVCCCPERFLLMLLKLQGSQGERVWGVGPDGGLPWEPEDSEAPAACLSTYTRWNWPWAYGVVQLLWLMALPTHLAWSWAHHIGIKRSFHCCAIVPLGVCWRQLPFSLRYSLLQEWLQLVSHLSAFFFF